MMRVFAQETTGDRGRVTALIRRPLEAWRRWRLFHRTRREMQAMSERELADLGLSRSMISRLAAETAYGK